MTYKKSAQNDANIYKRMTNRYVLIHISTCVHIHTSVNGTTLNNYGAKSKRTNIGPHSKSSYLKCL